MKKLVIFLGGVVCGVLILLLIQFCVKHFNPNVDEKIPIDVDSIIEVNPLSYPPKIHDPFYSENETDEPGEVIHEKSLKVVDVGNALNALVIGKDEFGSYNGTTYLLKQSVFAQMRKEMITFYDNQIIKIPKGKELRMFGTYTYESRGAGIRTIPIIRIVDKK